MFSKTFAVLITCIIIASGCKQSTESIQNSVVQEIVSNHPSYVTDMETAHKKDLFLNKQSVCFNIDLTFGGNTSSQKITTTTNSSAIKAEKSDGTITIMKDGAIYTSADSSDWAGEQFGIYTYQYFFMLPYKMSEQGTKWNKRDALTINDKNYSSAQLTFESGTGDAPDDWYIMHPDPETDLVAYAGYIVTGGSRTVEEAEARAHAIAYHDYIVTDGVPLSQRWSFHKYKKDESVGDEIGNAKLKNVLFLDELEETYSTEGLTKITK